MTQQLLIIVIGLVVLFWVYVICRLKMANREINRLLQSNERLTLEKKVAETQVGHFETRKKNEQNNRNANRDALIDGLHKSGDLRD